MKKLKGFIFYLYIRTFTWSNLSIGLDEYLQYVKKFVGNHLNIEFSMSTTFKIVVN